MEITEVRVKLVENSSERLRAFCSITLDGDFVIRDLKVIDGSNGAFVAMPSRKLMDRCSRCGAKNHLRARFCNECGAKLNEGRAPRDPEGRSKLHADVAHPINAGCRERVQKAVIAAYQEELERSKQPDYKPARYDDYDDYDEDFEESSSGRGGSRRGRETHRVDAAKNQPEPAAEDDDSDPQGVASPFDDGGEFDDYNSLIADLRRDAAGRQDDRRFRGKSAEEPSVEDESESEPVSSFEEDEASEEPQPSQAGARGTTSRKPESDDEFGAGL